MNEVFRNITIKNYKELILAFENSRAVYYDEKEKKLRHAGEYGVYREEVFKRFIRPYIPERYGIGTGFIITSSEEISTQCDVIIYDKILTPTISNDENQRFFPIETVLGVGEVKSNVNDYSTLNDILDKLSKFKEYRSKINYDIKYFHNDLSFPTKKGTINPFKNLFTFLVCKKLPDKFEKDNINESLIETKFKHNMILSLDDGLLWYRDNERKINIPYSNLNDIIFSKHFVTNNDDPMVKDLPTPIMSFVTAITQLINWTEVIIPDFSYYLYDENKLVNRKDM